MVLKVWGAYENTFYLVFLLIKQPFVIQAHNINFKLGILLQNSKFNYTHLSGHILGSYSPLANL